MCLLVVGGEGGDKFGGLDVFGEGLGVVVEEENGNGGFVDGGKV